MQKYKPEKILIEESVLQKPMTKRVLDTLNGIPVEIIPSTETLIAEYQQNKTDGAASFTSTKKILLLAEQKGSFLKKCPGQQSRGKSKNVCCDYFVINSVSNCHMECSYCYLQGYLNFPYIIVYANTGKLLRELGTAFASNPEQLFRTGTGELADSLALDWITGFSEVLVEFFSLQKNAVLELKTKSDCIENLLGLQHNGRTAVAWSLNPPEIAITEELYTSSLEERFLASAKCVNAGYPVAFHFDPIVDYQGWQEGYESVVKIIFRHVPAERVAWISLGTLRMTPELYENMRKHFPLSPLPQGELLPSADGKLRYFKAIRLQMYREMIRWIKKYGGDIPVYLCMERPDLWKKVFNQEPPEWSEINNDLVRGMLEMKGTLD